MNNDLGSTSFPDRAICHEDRQERCGILMASSRSWRCVWLAAGESPRRSDPWMARWPATWRRYTAAWRRDPARRPAPVRGGTWRCTTTGITCGHNRFFLESSFQHSRAEKKYRARTRVFRKENAKSA